MVVALLAHRLEQDVEKAQRGNACRDDDRVFARQDGTDLRPSAVSPTFRRLAAEAGLRPVRPHVLLHVAAGLLLASGEDLHTVSTWRGHSNDAVTVEVYSHLLDGVGRQMATAAEALVPPRAHTAQPDAHTSG